MDCTTDAVHVCRRTVQQHNNARSVRRRRPVQSQGSLLNNHPANVGIKKEWYLETIRPEIKHSHWLILVLSTLSCLRQAGACKTQL